MSVDANYFLTAMPWAGIEDAIIDDQYMVKIPKFYLRCFTPSAGPYQGKKCWEISDSAASGFHVHPAFMRAGRELPCFYIGKYAAHNAGGGKAGSAVNQMPWVNINKTSAAAACAARNIGGQAGWHLQTIYERAAIALLALAELGASDVQTAIGAGNVSSYGNMQSDPVFASGATTAKYRGIYELWGNLWEYADGLIGNGTTAQIFDNQGNLTYVDTGVIPAGDGWIRDVYDTSGEKFDLADIFLPKTVDKNESSGTFSDYNWRPVAGFITFIGGAVGHGVHHCGLFCTSFWSTFATCEYRYCGFRMAKW